jgi:hypothetical protein
MIKKVMWPLAPIPGESLMGLIARVAAYNVIDDTLSITSQAGQRYGHRTSLVYDADADLGALGVALRVDESELRARAHPALGNRTSEFFGLTISSYHLETRMRRFSPGSLAKASYHRAAWQYRPIPFCTESWEYLTDRCDACGHRQRWYHAQGPDRCDACGAALQDVHADYVPEAWREALAFVAGLADPDRDRRALALARLPAQLAHLKPEKTLELMLHFGHLTAGNAYRGRRDTLWRDDPAAQAKMLHASAELVLGWPDKPIQYLLDRFAAQTGSGNNAVLRSAGNLFSSKHLSVLSEEAAAVVKSLTPKCGAVAAGEAPTTVRRASTATGLSRQQLGDYRRAGWLRSVIFSNESGAPMVGFDGVEIDWLAAAIRSRRSTSTVATQLGISLHGVEQLVCGRFITPIDHPVFKARYSQPQFDGASVDDLIGRLVAKAYDDMLGIPLRQAVRAIAGPKPWAAIIEAMLDGRLQFALPASCMPKSGSGKRASRCDPRRGEAEAHRRVVTSAIVAEGSVALLRTLAFQKANYPEFEFDTLMSKADALEALNLLPRHCDVLDAGTDNQAALRYRTIRVDYVESTANDFVSISELRARSGPYADLVQAKLAEAGLRKTGPFGWPRAAAEAAVFQID